MDVNESRKIGRNGSSVDDPRGRERDRVEFPSWLLSLPHSAGSVRGLPVSKKTETLLFLSGQSLCKFTWEWRFWSLSCLGQRGRVTAVRKIGKAHRQRAAGGWQPDNQAASSPAKARAIQGWMQKWSLTAPPERQDTKVVRNRKFWTFFSFSSQCPWHSY